MYSRFFDRNCPLCDILNHCLFNVGESSPTLDKKLKRIEAIMLQEEMINEKDYPTVSS